MKHHWIIKVLIVVGTLSLLTAISQWNEHYRMNKLEKALIHLQENDTVQDSTIQQLQYQCRVDSVVGIYDHSQIR